MAYSGQILDNPVSGERIIFRETAADTSGERLVLDLTLTPDGHVPGAHIHPEQEERFDVVEGTMRFTRGRETIVARAGDTIIVPPGATHKFENAGKIPARARVEVRPALGMERLLETTAALAMEGRTNHKGMPKPLDLAVFMREFEREVRAPFPPPAIVRATLAPLAWLATLAGLDERHRRPVPAEERLDQREAA